ncbi:MAG TPA: histidine kinase [Candidatus Limiplasma sp.]|nr:histidine kinase [Candidatus Limiplasma sp.]HPS82074.1 histidine kinase [Candidatus Limiplasma sp.]
MKWNRKYLSHCVMVWVGAQALIVLLLAAGCVLASRQGAWAMLITVAIFLEACLCIVFYFWIFRPYQRTERMIGLFLEGYSLSSLDNSGVSLSPVNERLTQYVKEELNTNRLLKLSKRQAQYRALQNQINPHFLYNTLESIRSEALVAGLNSVADMTEALAVFFRYTISKVENLVTVEEELQNCETYFRIQQYRFGPRLNLRIVCAPEDKEEIYRCRIPKLTLQPILENGIVHGTEFKIGAGKLTVRLERTEKLLTILVSDDGIGMDENALLQLNERLDKSGRAFQEDKEEHVGGVALVNVNNRIHLLFGEEYGLHVFSIPMAGTDVRITLPMITSNRELMRNEVLS